MAGLSSHLPVIPVAIALLFSTICSGQQTATPPDTENPQSDKRILGIIPNYRTFPTLADYKPLTAKEKFKIAFDDSFDRGTVVLAAAFAGEAQLSKSDPTFGQGVEGYGHYFGGSSAECTAFSRDGKWIAYVTYPEGSLWRSRIDGSERLRLTDPPLYALNPCLSRLGELSQVL